MTYYSQVNDAAFRKIQSGQRLIEPRLNDDAHRKIRPGDLLIITNRITGEELLTKIVGVLRYGSFKELVAANPVSRFGVADERDLLTEMKRYYSDDQELTNGVLGLKLHVLKGEHGS